MVKGKAGDAQTPPRQAPKNANGATKKTGEPLAADTKKTSEAPQAAPETPPPPAGDNNPPPTLFLADAEERASYWSVVVKRSWNNLDSEIDALNDEIKDLKDRKKQVAKEAKARLGLNRGDIEFGVAAAKALADDASGQVLIDEARRRKELLSWEEHPLAMQMDLFPEQEVDRTPLVDRAEKDGYEKGRDGEICSVPPQYANQSQPWMNGWGRGQIVLMALFKKLEDEKEKPDQTEAWPDDKDVLAAAADGIGDAAAVSNVVPIGTAPATSEAV